MLIACFLLEILFIFSGVVNTGNGLQRSIAWGANKHSTYVKAINIAHPRNSLIEKVETVIKQKGAESPYLTQNASDISIDTHVEYKSDMIEVEGDDFYSRYAQYSSTSMGLPDSCRYIERISSLSSDKVIIQWNVSFIPENLGSIVSFSRAIGLNITFYNILDKERIRSTFSWQALGKVLTKAFWKGQVSLPHAVIRGTSEMTFSPSTTTTQSSQGDTDSHPVSWKLIQQIDKLNLIRSLDSGILKNRKLTLDLLEFVDAQKPPWEDLNRWNDVIVRRLNVGQVPGMKQFDIDGLDDLHQKGLLETSNRILTFVTGAVLLLGLSIGTVVFDKIFAYHQNIDF
eukprot:gene4079-8115_t